MASVDPATATGDDRGIGGAGELMPQTGTSINPEQLGLKILYPPEGSPEAGKVEVDVVAVHGIGAAPDWAWVAQETKMKEVVLDGTKEAREVVRTINWLEAPNMLPKAIPRARIMRFGYESQWFGDAAVKQRLPTVANTLLKFLVMERKKCKYRPIVFIGHCFGGLVIQKAYSLARGNSDDWPGIAISTTGMVFMGTPHHGTGSITSQGLMYSVIAEGMHVEDSVLKALSTGDEALGDALKEFMRLVNVQTARIQICCFFEQKQTSVGTIIDDASLKEFVVNEESGTLAGHQSFGLPLDHFTLNKFLSPKDGNFRIVTEVIQDMVLASTEIMKNRELPQDAIVQKPVASPTSPTISSLQPRVSYRPLSRPPFLRDPKFVSHGDILQRIEQKFEKHPRVALYGNSGNGKTHIAIEYAHKYSEEHPGAKVLWVNARDLEQFEHTYKSNGSKLSIQSLKDPKTNVLNAVCRHLRQEAHGQWLMVLDGADDQEMFHKKLTDSSKEDKSGKQRQKTLLDYIPTCSSGTVLITTRSLSLASEMVNQQMDSSIEITPLAVGESISLLRKTLSEEVCDETGALDLVKALHQSPIAISQATAYIIARGKEITIADYLALLKSQPPLKLGGEDTGNPVRPNEAESTAVATWQILYDFIRQKYPDSVSLLSVIGVLDLQRIPIFLLNKLSDNARTIKAALALLAQFGMITFFANHKFISANRLVQLSTQAHLTQIGEKKSADERALWLLTNVFPGDIDEYETCEILYPYAKLVLGFQPTSPPSKLHLATLAFNIAAYYKHLGKFDDARRNLEESLKLREEGLGKDSSEVQDTKKELETLQEAQRQSESGTQITKDKTSASNGKQGSVWSSALLRTPKWSKALTKVQSYLHLAQTSLDEEQLHEAETKSKEGLEECEKTLGNDHLDTLRMLDSLARVYQSQGRQDEALVTRIRVLEWCKNKYGPDHIDTIRQTYNLALTYDLQGQYEQATNLYLAALTGTRKILGPDNPEALRILCSLATIYDIQGHTDQAESTFREALAGQKTQLGDDHPETLLTMHNLALCAQSRNDLSTAESYLLQVLSSQERVLGPEHSATLRTASNLALNFRLRKMYAQAEPLYLLALEGQQKRLGESHPDTLATRFMLGELYEELGRKSEAQEQYRKALEGRERILGTEHKDTILTKQVLEGLGVVAS